MKVKEESEDASLKLNIQKSKITASSPITSWQIDCETMEKVRDFIFLGSKITADGDCSHEIKRCFWTAVLEKIHESPLNYKEIKPVNPKENESSIFIGRTDAETPIFWPPDANSWLTGKDPDAGKNWRQEKGMTEDEMVGWHQQLNGHEFE